MSSYQELIKKLVDGGHLKTPRIIKAFEKIDRADFVPKEMVFEAYINAPLPIGFGQTISQPLTVAFMLELLQPQTGDKILEIGSGSAWQTAILTELVGAPENGGKVFAMEIIDKLLEFGRSNLKKYRFEENGRVELSCQDGSAGLIQHLPFDKIIAAASASDIPAAWKEQLKVGGRIVAPVGASIKLVIKKSPSEFEENDYPGFAFVPLVTP